MAVAVLLRDRLPGAQTHEHPPTETMNRAAGEKGTSSQDAQRQKQGQQAQGAPSLRRRRPIKVAEH
jgi:hypothetical protein